jgi:hypothetical protein
MAENLTDNPAVNEAIKIINMFKAKSLFCEMMILQGENPGGTFLVFIIENTAMFKMPLKNDIDFIYSSGCGVHRKGLEVYDPEILEPLFNKYSSYYNFISTNLPLAYDDELRNNESFEELLAMKAVDGLKFYHLPDLNNPGKSYLIPMFAGFLKLNKADTVGVAIYDLDQLNHLIKFKIYKKKINREVEMVCRTLKV